MNSKSTHPDTTASIHTHHALQLELQAVGGAIRLTRRAPVTTYKPIDPAEERLFQQGYNSNR